MRATSSGTGQDGTPEHSGVRVALVTSSYAPHVGGVEEHVRQVASELHGMGAAVEVWTVDRGTGPGVRIVESLTVRYLPTPLPSASLGGIARFLAAFPAAWAAWVSARRSFRPDVFHVQCFGPNGVYALALHRWFRVPLIVTSHGETVADDNAVFERSAVLRMALRRALARAVAVTAPSRFVLDELGARFGLIGGEVVPNGVDLAIAGAGERSAFDGRYFLGVGRLGRIKGFDLLIDAFAKSDLDAGIRLVIVGDGPERTRLEALVGERGLGGRVVLAGRLDPSTVADAMAGSVAVVVPSRVEAFGIVALEAWRSAAPLVMTARGGAPGFVRDGVDGILVDPLDAVALAAAMQRVAVDDGLRARLVEAGLRKVREFTWRRVAEAYAALYVATLDGSVRRARPTMRTREADAR